jgi:hypothetical protein
MASTSTSANINGKFGTLEKGDIVKIWNNELCTFIEARRTNFLMKNHKDNKTYLYRYNENLIKSKEGKDKSVLGNNTKSNNLKEGDLFAIDGKTQTFIFQKQISPSKFVGICLASGRVFTIASSFNLVKIDINVIKKQHSIK